MKKLLFIAGLALVAAGCTTTGPAPANQTPAEQVPAAKADDIDAVISALENSVKDEEALQKQVVTDIIRTDKQQIIKLVNEATDDTDY